MPIKHQTHLRRNFAWISRFKVGISRFKVGISRFKVGISRFKVGISREGRFLEDENCLFTTAYDRSDLLGRAMAAIWMAKDTTETSFKQSNNQTKTSNTSNTTQKE